MVDLLVFFFLVSLTLFIVSLFKKDSFGKLTKKLNNLDPRILFGVLAALFFVAVGIVAPPPKEKSATETKPTPTAKPTATATPSLAPTPTQDPFPQEPKARIEAIISKQGDFEITVTDAKGGLTQPAPPYEVIVNQKDLTEWRDKCDQAKDKAFNIEKSVYSDPIAAPQIGRLLVNLRPVLSVSLGGDDGRSTDWSNAPAFYAKVSKTGLSLSNEESVPVQKRTWATGNQYPGFGACQF